MRILQFGRTGQLARELLNRAPHHDVQILALGRGEADLTDPVSVERAVRAHADVDIVVNAAAYTAVDQAEADETTARLVNAESPAAMARACADLGLPLLHVSTDYVFDGESNEAYAEDAHVAPIGAYGRTKAAGEAGIRAALEQHVIVRTAWVYSAHGKNFVKTMLRLGGERPELRVVDDQRGCPTAAGDLADAILTIAEAIAAGRGRWGTYHFVNSGETTWRRFAEAIFEQSRPWTTSAPRVVPITTADFPTPAKRPRNSALKTDAVQRDYGIEPRPWPAALDDVLRSIHGGSAAS